MENYEEFIARIQKRGSKPYKLSHCLGSRDAFHWVRKNKWKSLGGTPCDKLLYSRIVSEVNRQILDLVLDGHEVQLPYRMGSLQLACAKARVTIEDGEIKTNYRTDWKRTLRFLYEDEEARNAHKRIKRVQPLIYNVRYYKRGANFTNKRFYLFRPNRSVLKTLGAAVEERRLDAEQIIY